MRPIHKYNFSSRKPTNKNGERVSLEDWVTVFRALGNGYRLRILLAVFQDPGITLDQINQAVGGDFRNISAHTKKLVHADLIQKRYQGKHVTHTISPRGKTILSFLKKHSNIL